MLSHLSQIKFIIYQTIGGAVRKKKQQANKPTKQTQRDTDIPPPTNEVFRSRGTQEVLLDDNN